jgi:hypothetical protein
LSNARSIVRAVVAEDDGVSREEDVFVGFLEGVVDVSVVGGVGVDDEAGSVSELCLYFILGS